MSTSIGIGWSKDRDSLTAAKFAAGASIRSLGQKTDLAIVFSSLGFDLNKVLEGISETIESDNIIGCSGTSIITDQGVEKKAVTVMAIASDELQFKFGVAESIHPDKVKEAGRALARSALREFSGGKRDLFMTFCDGLISDTSNLIQGAQEILGKSFPLVGAASSDDLKFTKTAQFFKDRVLNNSAVGILWTGGINFGIGIRHGWKPLGRPRQVTAAHRNIIKTIENKPAVNVYEDYFGKKIKELRYPMLARMGILYPLGIYLAAEHDYILRNVLGVFEDGSLIFQGDIPQGSEIRIMIGTKESALEAAKEAAQEAKAALRGRRIKTAIIFDSISRNKLLGRAAFSEIETVKEILGEDTPIMGFYTYGELAPLKALDYRGESYFHNETINIFALGE